MEIILTQDFAPLGKALDVVYVRDGYARNYLIPSNIAMVATKGNRKAVEEKLKFALKRESKKADEARKLAAKIEKVPCTIPVKVGEEDQVYGSVGTQDISDFLNREGFEIERRMVLLEEPIKQLGVYNVEIQLHKEITATLKVWVVKEEQ